MKKLSHFLLSVLMLGAFSASAFGAPADEVSGTVKDTKGNPIVGATVTQRPDNSTSSG